MRKIIVDIYGADNGHDVIIDGTRAALARFDDLFITFVGDETAVSSRMNGEFAGRWDVRHTTDYIKADENPACIYGGRDESSMAMSLDLLKSGEYFGMMSAGNTGALLVGSICRLGLINGIKTPALAALMPSYTGRTVCLADCGANLDCKPGDLVKYALMGSALISSAYGVDSPRVGLVSVGREQGKGNEQTKEAFCLLSKQNINFIGNIEGSDIASAHADVAVCDGFVGNVILKCAEASAKTAAMLAASTINDEAAANTAKEAVYEKFDFNARGGAMFLGVKKPVLKMHGAADGDTAFYCIDQLYRLSKSDYEDAIAHSLDNIK